MEAHLLHIFFECRIHTLENSFGCVDTIRGILYIWKIMVYAVGQKMSIVNSFICIIYLLSSWWIVVFFLFRSKKSLTAKAHYYWNWHRSSLLHVRFPLRLSFYHFISISYFFFLLILNFRFSFLWENSSSFSIFLFRQNTQTPVAFFHKIKWQNTTLKYCIIKWILFKLNRKKFQIRKIYENFISFDMQLNLQWDPILSYYLLSSSFTPVI